MTGAERTYLPALRALGHTLALSIGAASFLVLFGPDFLFNRSPYLLHPGGDISAEMGAYFRMAQDSWRFPLFDLPTANDPEGANQIIIGGVPILALLAKILRSLTGETLNLFGPWFFLCVVLQAHSFYFLLLQIDDRKPLLCAAASLIAVLTYGFMTRFGHVALFAQFINIYAVAFVVATTRDDAKPQRIVAWLAGLALLATFIFAYLGFSNIVMLGAGLVSLWWLGRISIKQASIYLATFCATLLALCWVAGYFWAIGKAEPVPAFAFASLALNVGSLFFPHQSALFPSWPLFWRWWEGDFYLGTAIVTLWLAVLLGNPRPMVFGPLVRNWPMALVLLALTVFCASNRIQFGSVTLISYEMPSFMEPFVGQLRAGGRMFWPVGYLLIAAPLTLAIQSWPRLAPAIVSAAVLISILDATGTYGFLTRRITTPGRVAFAWDGLNEVIRQHRAVRIYPSFWCDTGTGDSLKLVLHKEIEYAMGLANVPTNSTATSRKIKDCSRERESMHVLEPGELNLFLNDATVQAALALTKLDPAQVCRRFKLDKVTALMCSREWTAEMTLPLPELHPL